MFLQIFYYLHDIVCLETAKKLGLCHAGGFTLLTFLYTGDMATDREVEIKFKIDDIDALTASLQTAGFGLITPRTHEMNTLYDQPRSKLRRRGALLRLRQYGPRWTVTYKDRSGRQSGRHKSRREIETQVENGEALAHILEAIGFNPSFRYEKYRSEW